MLYTDSYNNLLSIDSLAVDIAQTLAENGVTTENSDAVIQTGSVGFNQTTLNTLETNQDMKSSNFVTGTSGWQIQGDGDVEFNDGTFRGTLEAGSIHIPNQTTANSFHVESDGDTFWGCTQANFTSSIENAKAYVLKSGVAKFAEGTVIGSGNNKITYDSATSVLQSTNQVITQTFTAGENLTANKFVCFKVGSNISNKEDNSDSWVRQNNADTNYGTDHDLWCGHVDGEYGDLHREVYLKFQTLPTNISAASLNIYCFNRYGSDTLTVQLYSLDADFDQSTITWNNAPASTIISGATKNVAYNDDGKWWSIDITAYMVGLQRTSGTFYGLRIVPDGASFQWVKFHSYDAEEALVPYISFTQEGTDGKVYLADRDSYALSRFVIGKTLEAKDTDEAVNVQVAGIMDNLSFDTSEVGYPAMLMDDGGAGMTSLSRIIEKNSRNVELGMILSISQIMFNVNKGSDFYISSKTATVTGATTSYTSSVYPPLFARKAIVEFSGTNSRGNYSDTITVYKDSNQIVSKSESQESSVSISVSADWSSIINKIVITFTSSSDFNNTPTATVWYYE